LGLSLYPCKMASLHLLVAKRDKQDTV
jgi:hypothetical protein